MAKMSTRGEARDYDYFCALLKKLREDKGLTQAELAQRLKVPQSFVSKYETGERRLDFVETTKVCGALGLTIGKFTKAYSSLRETGGGRR